MVLARRRSRVLAIAALLVATRVSAKDADPSTLSMALSSLVPGDTLNLASGTYPAGLVLTDLNGTESAWITITGPAPPAAPAVIEANPSGCCDTVEIRNSSYLALRNLIIDSKGMSGIFGVNAKAEAVHHIMIEGSTFQGQGASQQTDAISTKTPTWGWVIRGNRILGPGTGLYLGNSDGTDPFIGGLIEYNLVQNPIGYCMEIKWQQLRPATAGMPTGDSTTVVRHNVFIKNDQPSPDGDRPNVLFGGFPDSGPGMNDLYEVYGNLFVHNPRESLVQASGRVSIHDNVFVDVAGTALLLQDHDLPLRLAHVYNNTIYAAGSGIHFGSSAAQGDLVVGNLVFAGTAVSGSIQNQVDNLVDTVAAAGSYVARPSTTLGAMDFYPLAGACEGSALDLSTVATDTEYDRDFNGTPKGGFTFRGAYAGSGHNPGFVLDAQVPPQVAPGGSGTGGSQAAGGGGGTDGAPGGAGAGPDAGAVAGHDAACGCRIQRRSTSDAWGAVALLLLASSRRVSRDARRSNDE
jgi:hypothetical protein